VAWRIGITIVPEHRRRGYGAAAQRGLADQLFATTEANRVEADTDVTNLAEQRALERAGFVRESVVKAAQYRGADYHDLVLYRVLRHELEDL
jgi:RimJ/RimL family protein N-acetyltransferase